MFKDLQLQHSTRINCYEGHIGDGECDHTDSVHPLAVRLVHVHHHEPSLPGVETLRTIMHMRQFGDKTRRKHRQRGSSAGTRNDINDINTSNARRI